MAALVQQMAALVSAHELLVDRVDRLEKDMRDEFGWVKGVLLEMRHSAKPYTYFQRVAKRLRVLDPPALDDVLDELVAEGKLTEDAAEEVRLADTIASGRRDGESVYLIVESSFGIGLDDVQPARRHADLLGCPGVMTIAIVADSWIADDVAQAARDAAVWRITELGGTVSAAA